MTTLNIKMHYRLQSKIIQINLIKVVFYNNKIIPILQIFHLISYKININWKTKLLAHLSIKFLSKIKLINKP
jgi:hypothetical protein